MRRLAYALLALTLLLAACGPIQDSHADEVLTTTTTAPQIPRYSGIQEITLWERGLPNVATAQAVRIKPDTPAGDVSLIFLRSYDAAIQQEAVRAAEEVLGTLPDELLEKISPARIYVHSDQSACRHPHARVGGCTPGGKTMLMILSNQRPNLRVFRTSLIHEVGHLIDWHDSLRPAFDNVRQANLCGTPTNYGQESLPEDIAETFSHYARFPDILEKHSKNRFDFFEARYGSLDWRRTQYTQEQLDVADQRTKAVIWNCHQAN